MTNRMINILAFAVLTTGSFPEELLTDWLAN